MNSKRWWDFAWWKVGVLFASYLILRLGAGYVIHSPLDLEDTNETLDLLWTLICFISVAIYIVGERRERKSRKATGNAGASQEMRIPR